MLKLVDEVELVGEASCVERDSTNEHVGSSERGGQNDSLEEEAESKSSSDESTGDVDDPEECFRLSSEEGSSVDQKSSNEASPASNASSSELLALVK